MVQSPPKPIAIDEFITNYGDSDCYELIDGELTEMEPTGPHEQVSAFIGRKLNVAIDRLDLPYFIPPRCLIKLLGTATAFRPDVLVLDQTRLINEPLWQQQPVITWALYFLPKYFKTLKSIKFGKQSMAIGEVCANLKR